MQTVSDVYPSEWLKARDINGGGTITIRSAMLEYLRDFHGKEKPQIVLRFEKSDKKCSLNATQARELADLFQDERFDNWAGKRAGISTKKLATGNSTITFGPVLPETVSEVTEAMKPAEVYETAEDEIPF